MLGPGLLESVYEEGLPSERPNPLPVFCKGMHLDCGYQVDLLFAGHVIVERKAREALAPIRDAIVLTYLRLSGCRIELPNPHSPVVKQAIRRLGLTSPKGIINRREGRID
jgi:GxxExxY protein